MPIPMVPAVTFAAVFGTLLVVAPVAPVPTDPGPAAVAGTEVAARPAPGVPTTAATSPARSSALPGRARSATTRPATPWRWPLAHTPLVLHGFRPPPQRWQAGHRGVDLSAVPGDSVVAAGRGLVTFAGPLAGRGVVTVTHGALRTTYEPVSATVRVGDDVAAGEPIGTLASGVSHCGGYPSCLHWGLLRGTLYLDPLLLLGLGRPILLPIPTGAPPR
ncbi:MAG: M23 family metallopeptidase [Candidatus Nanopelagicales bacterium]